VPSISVNPRLFNKFHATESQETVSSHVRGRAGATIKNEILKMNANKISIITL
jgi:hypothetical protein